MEIPITVEQSELVDYMAQIPELRAMVGCTQSPPHRFDVFSHTLQVWNYARLYKDCTAGERPHGGLSRAEILELAAVLHDIGKPDTRSIGLGKVTFHGHNHAGANMIHSICKRLTMVSFDDMVSIRILVDLHLRPAFLVRNGVTKHAAYRLGVAAGEWLPELMVLALADRWGKAGDQTDPEEFAAYSLALGALQNQIADVMKERGR